MKVAACNPRRKISGEKNPAVTVTLDIGLPIVR
jgi:hypothetical protein